MKKWESYFKESAAKEAERKTKANTLRGRAMLAILVIIAGVVGAANSPELKRYLRSRESNEMIEYIEKNKGDKPINKIDPASFNDEKKEVNKGSVKINCDSPVWKKRPICN